MGSVIFTLHIYLLMKWLYTCSNSCLFLLNKPILVAIQEILEGAFAFFSAGSYKNPIMELKKYAQTHM